MRYGGPRSDPLAGPHLRREAACAADGHGRAGRLRLDAVARFLQEIAIDDVDETGWGAPDHLWFVRRMRIDVLEPFLADRAVELITWCAVWRPLQPVDAGR
jgi:acyl-ACP thioesterase